jgi:DNA topoisomerase-1
MNLVIVESPTKAKTISKFLGNDYTVESSYGHIRDLPKSTMGVDVEHEFEPKYVIPQKARARVKVLKDLAKKSEMVYFATDEDREGEAISWHLAELLDVPTKKVQRIVFHEVTKSAVQEALESPRPIDQNLVNAQQARRILDRLVGYELSPFLWKKVYKGLSAGRVQSVAVRLVVEREREIQAFKAQEYWTIEGQFSKQNDHAVFPAKLVAVDGKTLKKFDLGNKTAADEVLSRLKGAPVTVASVQKKAVTKNPPPPFTTSTLQQVANRKLGFSAKQTMMLAQQLYEGVSIGDEGSVGLITYMRTDAVNLSQKFLEDAASALVKLFGASYRIAEPRRYKKVSKLAQEAHEAIRPTEALRDPASVQPYLDSRQYKLYELIWNRALATQMPQAQLDATTIDLQAGDRDTFRATGSLIRFDGYLKLYRDAVKENFLPDLAQGDAIDVHDLQGLQHFTEPPPRYSDASLVKALEEDGIGRPSTYAPTLSTIQERGYVEKEDGRFKPVDVGLLVNDLLVKHFPEIVDFKFTAHMEDELDEIASGKREWVPIVRSFYQPFKEHLMTKDEEVKKSDVLKDTTDEVCEKCGKPMAVKMSRFGKFLGCTGYPECRNLKQLDANGAPAEPEKTDEKCALCGKPMVIKQGRYGKFLGCSDYPTCKGIKNIEKSTGVKCPACGKGDIVERRSRRGKMFYACNQYPECKQVYWSKPTGDTCPTCGSLLVYGKQNLVTCSSKTCDYKKEVTPAA